MSKNKEISDVDQFKALIDYSIHEMFVISDDPLDMDQTDLLATYFAHQINNKFGNLAKQDEPDFCHSCGRINPDNPCKCEDEPLLCPDCIQNATITQTPIFGVCASCGKDLNE